MPKIFVLNNLIRTFNLKWLHKYLLDKTEPCVKHSSIHQNTVYFAQFNIVLTRPGPRLGELLNESANTLPTTC